VVEVVSAGLCIHISLDVARSSVPVQWAKTYPQPAVSIAVSLDFQARLKQFVPRGRQCCALLVGGQILLEPCAYIIIAMAVGLAELQHGFQRDSRFEYDPG
jgi:hypothetical protein